MKTLIITEDPTYDAFIVEPIVNRLLADANLRGPVDTCRDPTLRGADQALDRDTVADIVGLYPMVDLFILIVDNDCNRKKHQERAHARCQEHAGKLLACLAIQEVEVWMCALHRKSLGIGWSEVREECDPKERFADPLLDRLGRRGPGDGRKRAMRALSGQWAGLLRVCSELSELAANIRAWAAAR